MKKTAGLVLGMACCCRVWAATLYVDLNSTTPAAPFDGWASAATNIQDAVDASAAGDTVIITNGHYLLSSEIVITNAITLQSVNGPEETIVDGQGSVRCFSLGDFECVIESLTITNGYADGDGGGIYCSSATPVITNSIITGNSSGNSANYGGGIFYGTVNNCMIIGNVAAEGGGGLYRSTANGCTITNNSAGRDGGGIGRGVANNCTISGNIADDLGGGIYDGTANHCTISGNTARDGGGMYGGTANYCTIAENSAEGGGGGMWEGTANSCTITDNTADNGGGIYGCTANHCTIRGNTASSRGGGMRGGTANDCLIIGNTAGRTGGGGVYVGTANNCTIVGNVASRFDGGGMYAGTANNCIIWNNGEDVTSSTTVHYSCSPNLDQGVDGNITSTPRFVDAAGGNYQLMTDSPCINRGDNDAVVGLEDLVGQSRIAGAFVDMGAHEYQGPFTEDMDGDSLPDEWESRYFSANPSPDGNDDWDGLSNADEYLAGTDPTNSASFFMITNCCPEAGFSVEWSPCVTGRVYRVVWSDSLTNAMPVVLEDNIEYPQNSYIDTEYNAENAGFYRVEVRMK